MTRERFSITTVNKLDRAAFVARFGGVYERSPWVAERTWDSLPFADRNALERVMQEVVLASGRARQLELLRLHPALGTRKPLSDYSRREQAGAGLMGAGDVERRELQGLNRLYEVKFGFPFILAVRDANLDTILDSCRTRLNHDLDFEFDESLRQVFRIASFRLADLVTEGK